MRAALDVVDRDEDEGGVYPDASPWPRPPNGHPESLDLDLKELWLLTIVLSAAVVACAFARRHCIPPG